MIDPSNIRQLPLNIEENIVLKMKNVPDCDIEVYDIYDDKSFKKLITDVEREVRQSTEYKRMISYMHEYMDMNKCSFLKDISTDSQNHIRIEIHHYPFTLYDICIIVFNKRLFYHESLELEMIAKEVMLLHYKLFVGLIPLSQTAHELVHSSYLFIPINNILGNYTAFVNQYTEFMLPEHIDVLERIEEYSKNYNEKQNMEILKQSNVKLETSGTYKLPDLSSIYNSMGSRIEAIKQNGYQLPQLSEEDYKKKLEEQNKPKKIEPFYFF